MSAPSALRQRLAKREDSEHEQALLRIVIVGLVLAYMAGFHGWPSTWSDVNREIVLVLTGWAGAARVLRSQALSIRSKDFIAACLVTGERPLRIMFAEMLPNMASIMMGTFLSVVIGAIVFFVSLSTYSFAGATLRR